MEYAKHLPETDNNFLKSKFSPKTRQSARTPSRIKPAELLKEVEELKEKLRKEYKIIQAVPDTSQKLRLNAIGNRFSQLLKKLKQSFSTPKKTPLVVEGFSSSSSSRGGYNLQKYKKPNILKKQPKKPIKLKH